MNSTINSNTRLLSICCSFRRPSMLLDMINTFELTRSAGTELFIYLHLDDPFLEQYKVFIQGYNHIIERHRNMQEVVNHVVFERYPRIPYYQIICDDHLYKTKNWDTMLMDALSKNKDWGYACGRDLINGDDWKRFQHPSAEIWSWKMAELLGYVYPIAFKHQGMDFYTKDLALTINALAFVPEVIIEHLWYGGCDKPMDDNIKEKYSEEAMRQAHEAFDNWKKYEKPVAVRKIQEAMANGR